MVAITHDIAQNETTERLPPIKMGLLNFKKGVVVATKGLFEHWLEIELSGGRELDDVLADLNKECGTKYQRNWPRVMAGRGYSLNHMPTNVRRYMMMRVLPVALENRGLDIPAGKIRGLVVNLS